MTGRTPPPRVTGSQVTVLWAAAVIATVVGFGLALLGVLAFAQGSRGASIYLLVPLFLFVGASGVWLLRELIRLRRSAAELDSAREDLARDLADPDRPQRDWRE